MNWVEKNHCGIIRYTGATSLLIMHYKMIGINGDSFGKYIPPLSLSTYFSLSLSFSLPLSLALSLSLSLSLSISLSRSFSLTLSPSLCLFLSPLSLSLSLSLALSLWVYFYHTLFPVTYYRSFSSLQVHIFHSNGITITLFLSLILTHACDFSSSYYSTSFLTLSSRPSLLPLSI